MTLPLSVRIFFAIDLPAAAREKMTTFITALKKRAKTHSIRWSRPENLHITLQFLPEFVSADIPTLMDKVREVLNHRIHQPLFEIGHLHLFPSAFHPRVIVLDITPQDQLASLSAEIGKAIEACGYEIEKRAFKAHLTIGRIKNMRSTDLGFLSEFTVPAIEPIKLEKVVLFRSEPMPDGSHYTSLDEVLMPSASSALP